MGHAKFNYGYLLERAGKAGGRILDYGCGVGDIVALGHARGFDIWGVDSYQGYFANWSEQVAPEARDRVRRVEAERADFPDSHFDVLISNQVLEHVTVPEATLSDMYRLLRPGGLLIAAFPVVETWYEGHIGLYFAHRLKPRSRLRRAYFAACHRLGFGLYRAELTTAEWVSQSEKTLDDACFYYPRSRMLPALEKIFGGPVEDIAADYMRARLPALTRFSAAADPMLRLVYHLRAGEIVQLRKRAG